jgi:hypothetical protein
MKLAMLVVLASVRVAAADIDVRLELARSTSGESIEATVMDAPNLPVDRYVLVDRSADPPVEVHAERKREYRDGPEPLALALVIAGRAAWIDDELAELRAALDRVDVGGAGPAGSTIVVVSYADTPLERFGPTALRDFTGPRLGEAADYRGATGRSLAPALALALGELERTAAPRKALVVIGDDADDAPDALDAARRRAATAGVQTFAIALPGHPGPNVIARAIPALSTASSVGQAGVWLQAILSRIAGRRYLTFSADAFDHDGGAHDFIVRVDHEESDPVSLMLPERRADHRIWLVAGLILLVGGVLLARRCWQ